MPSSDDFDLSLDPEPNPVSADPAWKLHAVKLAVEHKLAGRARSVSRPDYPLSHPSIWHYTVASQSKPGEKHTVILDSMDYTVACDCMAGINGKPCAHAGAVVLLFCALAPNDATQE